MDEVGGQLEDLALGGGELGLQLLGGQEELHVRAHQNGPAIEMSRCGAHPRTIPIGTCTAQARTQRSVLGLAVIEDLHDLRDVALHVQGRVHRNRHDAGAEAAEAHLAIVSTNAR